MNLTCKTKFPKGYIAHPYWPARERLIDITKKSGINRARSEGNRERALDSYLKKIGMEASEFRELEAAADRPFYTARDVHIAADDEIVIPAHQIYGALAQACDIAPATIRLARAEQLRTLLGVSDIRTGKTDADGKWERFVTVTAGTGAKLSNQRALRINDYIGPFEGTLTLTFDPELVNVQRVRDFVIYTGREIGVGASRKMGWGRFDARFD